MNMNQLTQKSLAAIQAAQAIATEHGNPQIEQAHLLLALVSDGEGFIPQLLTAMGMTVPSFQAAVRAPARPRRPPRPPGAPGGPSTARWSTCSWACWTTRTPA